MKPRRRGRKPKQPIFVAQDADTTCPDCQAEFLEPEDLRVHIAQMHPYATGHTCTFCSISFPNVIDYLHHIRDEHLSRMKCCLYCSRCFIDSEELKLHENKHRNDINDMHSCSHCQLLFNNLKVLENHEAKNHSNSKEGIMLHNHYALLSTMLNVNAPMFIKSLGTDNIYICAKCKFTTPELNLYLGHVREKKCITYSCDHCANVFVKRSYLTKHFLVYPECSQIYDPSNLQKKCRTCKQTYDLRSFRTHLKKCKVVKCRQCNIVFDTVVELSEHQIKEHPMAVVLKKCRYCNQEIVGGVALAKHMQRLHKNDYHLYKYKCKVCNSIFKHPKLLLGHIFSKHRYLKPFSCDICNEKWRVRKSFTIHIKHKHNSVGYVEFDEDMNVHFSEQKSENPFQPPENPSLYNEVEAEELPPILTVYDSDGNTDVEGSSKKKLTRKNTAVTPKTRSRSKPQEIKTDLASDTDAKLEEQDESRKRKITLKECQSDDESLLTIRKRARFNRKLDNLKLLKRKTNFSRTSVPKRLTCNICKKFCYTIENYHRHVALHFKNESKQCIKCSKLFSTTDELEAHLKSAHATGHITETLKKLLEKRKKKDNYGNQTNRNKFQNTIKKVLTPPSTATAKLRLLDNDDISVKKFIENFSPEDQKIPIVVNTMVSIKPVADNTKRKAMIKMTKFKETGLYPSAHKLAMPVKCTLNRTDTHVLASITLVQEPREERSKLNFGTPINEDTNYYESNEDTFADNGFSYGNSAQTTIIPDVAQEVMLENTDDEPRLIQRSSIPHRMIIPKMTQNTQKIQVAHLQAQAPYYKIVPFEELMANNMEEVTVKTEPTEVTLPSGRRLVNINPLAHLLGDKADEILKTCEEKRKYYKYKPKFDSKKVLAEALIKLEKPTVATRTRRQKKK